MDPWNTFLQFLLLNLSPKQRTERFQKALKQAGIVAGKHPKKMGGKKVTKISEICSLRGHV